MGGRRGGFPADRPAEQEGELLHRFQQSVVPGFRRVGQASERTEDRNKANHTPRRFPQDPNNSSFIMIIREVPKNENPPALEALHDVWTGLVGNNTSPTSPNKV